MIPSRYERKERTATPVSPPAPHEELAVAASASFFDLLLELMGYCRSVCEKEARRGSPIDPDDPQAVELGARFALDAWMRATHSYAHRYELFPPERGDELDRTLLAAAMNCVDAAARCAREAA